MKKLVLALTSLIGTASAEISTGYYLGLGATSSHMLYKYEPSPTARADLGTSSFQGTVYTGYGIVMGCTYLGAELDYSLGKTSIRLNGVETAVGTSNFSDERNHIIGLAFRVGQKFTSNTMGYVRLGVNSAQYKAQFTTSTGNLISEQKKRKTSFAPGVGIETEVINKVLFRVQYTYDFGVHFDNVKLKTQAVTMGIAYKF